MSIRERRVVVTEGGGSLTVGIDAYPRNEMHELILRAFGWSAAITVVLAFGTGAVMSGSLLRRIEIISCTAREIMAGDFSRRIPVRGSEDEFDHLVASLNAMLARTESSMESVRQVSSDIAHDLRTPLTRLRQRLELAERRARTVEEWRDAATHCLREMDAILETFGALLRIAQIESGVAGSRFGEVDLSELLRTLIEVYQPTGEEKEQWLITDIASSLLVWGDRELLAQMVANVIENAMKHSPAKAHIGVTAIRLPSAIDVIVSDTGPGIPSAERGHVFQRFYRLEDSRSTPGSGLGLSLVEAIAALHHVAIELSDNEPGLRVTLRFVRLALPREAAPPVAALAVEPGLDNPAAAIAAAGSITPHS